MPAQFSGPTDSKACGCNPCTRWGLTRDALEGKGPQRRPQKRIDRRLEEVAKAVGGGYCQLQMPLKLAFAVRGTVAGHRLGALEGGWGDLLPFQCIPGPHQLHCGQDSCASRGMSNRFCPLAPLHQGNRAAWCLLFGGLMHRQQGAEMVQRGGMKVQRRSYIGFQDKRFQHFSVHFTKRRCFV